MANIPSYRPAPRAMGSIGDHRCVEQDAAASAIAELSRLRVRVHGMVVFVLILAVLLAVLGVWVRRTTTATPPKVLQVRRIELVDHAGRMRLVLDTAQEGAPRITLYDEAGMPRLGLAVSPEGSSVTFLDADGRDRLSLAAHQDVTFFDLQDRAERSRARLSVDGDGTSRLVLTDGKDGAAVLRAVAIKRCRRGGAADRAQRGGRGAGSGSRSARNTGATC